MENGGDFLHKKYGDLHTTANVLHEQTRRELTGEQTTQNPSEMIVDWLKVIERTHSGHQEDPRVLERIKQHYHREYVIKPEDVPEATFVLEQRIAKDLGYGYIEITDEFRKQKTDQIISSQERSLDKWVDYLSSSDANYPMWAKYWVFNSMVQMGKFEKLEKIADDKKVEFGRFKTRTKNTVASFPPLNTRALAMTINLVRTRLNKEPTKNISNKLNDADFNRLLSTESFSKIYSQFLIELPAYSTEGLQETRGQWKKYNRYSDPEPLVDSLDGYPLEWCTADIDTARAQLQGGDFYIYYSINENGEAKIPRIAILMQGNKIDQVRGIAPNQNLDPYVGQIVDDKLEEFPDGQHYKKKTFDMNMVSSVETKINRNEEMTIPELKFIWEFSGTIIEGFGYDDDPRINEIRQKRNFRDDLCKIYDCNIEDLTFNISQLGEGKDFFNGTMHHLVDQIFGEDGVCEWGNLSDKNRERIFDLFTSFGEDEAAFASIRLIKLNVLNETEEQKAKKLIADKSNPNVAHGIVYSIRRQPEDVINDFEWEVLYKWGNDKSVRQDVINDITWVVNNEAQLSVENLQNAKSFLSTFS